MTGQAIIKAILEAERDPHKLSAFRDSRVKASAEQIAQSLEGNWQPDLLFVLKQEQDGYEFCQEQMTECNRQLAQYLQQREDRSHGVPLLEEKRKGRLKKKKGNAPQFDLRGGLFRLSGTDLTQIDSIDAKSGGTTMGKENRENFVEFINEILKYPWFKEFVTLVFIPSRFRGPSESRKFWEEIWEADDPERRNWTKAPSDVYECLAQWIRAGNHWCIGGGIQERKSTTRDRIGGCESRLVLAETGSPAG
jgi:hypothetical protein